MDKEKLQRIKLIVAASVILVLVIAVAIRMIVYQKVGEKKMPYSISKIIVVSTANKYEKEQPVEEKEDDEDEPDNQEEQTEENNEESEESEENVEEVQVEEESLWDFDVVQTNDVYISIDRNEANIKKNEKLKSVSIKNISIDEKPVKGEIKAYMPNSIEGDRYSYKNEYVVKNSLTYRSAAESNFKDLQIHENGGVIGISFANVGLDKLKSNDEEIVYNGTLLGKLGITDDDLKCKISFDVIIALDDGKEYSGRVSIDLNCADLVESGTAKQEITDFSNVIFKRK